MSPWVRLLGAISAIVLIALLLKAVPPFLVLVLFVGGVATANALLRGRPKREAAENEARLLGLKREAEDPFGLVGYPLSLFQRAPEGRVENLLWGTWQGIEVKAFDYAFTAVLPTGAEEGRVLTCALAPMGEDLSALVVEPSAFVTVVAERPSAPTVDLSDPAFHSVFEVRCDDESFARALLDEDMRGWLDGLGDGWGVELSGRMAIIYGRPPMRPDVVGTLELLRGLVQRTSGRAAERGPSASALGPREDDTPPTTV